MYCGGERERVCQPKFPLSSMIRDRAPYVRKSHPPPACQPRPTQGRTSSQQLRIQPLGSPLQLQQNYIYSFQHRLSPEIIFPGITYCPAVMHILFNIMHWFAASYWFRVKIKIYFANVCSLTHSLKAQLRAPLSPLQTAWTGFDHYLYSSESSSVGPALVEIATARSFILNRGIVTDTMSATPLEPGWWAVHSTPARLLSARFGPCGRACRPVGIDCKGTMP